MKRKQQQHRRRGKKPEALKQKQRRARERRRIGELRRLPYREYLKSEHWRRKRHKTLRRAGWACETCGIRDADLEVHHLTYWHVGCERPWELMVLCRDCHQKEHFPDADQFDIVSTIFRSRKPEAA